MSTEEHETTDHTGSAGANGTAGRGRSRRSKVTRRGFLAGAGAAGVVSQTDLVSALRLRLPFLPSIDLDLDDVVDDVFDVGGAAGPGVNPSAPTHLMDIRRREDLLDLRLEFFNLQPDSSNPAVLRRVTENQPAVLVAVLQPQQISEQVIEVAQIGDGTPDTDAPIENVPGPPIVGVMSGLSRLAFKVPEELLPLPVSLDSLLDWSRLEPRLAPAASGLEVVQQQTPVLRSGLEVLLGGDDGLERPGPTHTAIELPWRLQLSPAAIGLGFSPSWESQINLGGESEGAGRRAPLWHARARPPESNLIGGRPALKARAIWSRDFDEVGHTSRPATPNNFGGGDANAPEDSLRIPLNRDRRWELVHQTSRYDPIDVSELAVTTLGGYFGGAWNTTPNGPPEGFSLESWEQTTTLGRDHHVELVNVGYLMPFGHEAAYMRVVDRQVETSEGGTRAAYNFGRDYLVVRNPRLSFHEEDTPHRPDNGRRFPFVEVECETTTSPIINPLVFEESIHSSRVFLAGFGGSSWRPQFRAIDHSGRQHRFDLPVVWVNKPIARREADPTSGPDAPPDPVGANDNTEFLQLAIEHYTNATMSAELGAELAFASEDAGDDHGRGATSFPTKVLKFGVEEATGGTSQQFGALRRPAFYPYLREAEVEIPAVERLADGSSATSVVYSSTFRTQGFGAGNPAELLLRTLSPPRLGFSQNGARSGAVAAPDFEVALLSRSRGAVGERSLAPDAGDEPDLSTFRPDDFLDPAAMLLAGTALVDLLKPSQGLERMPQTRTVERPDAVRTIMTWSPELENQTGDSVVQVTPDSTLDLRIVTDVPTGGGAPETTVRGDLRNVGLHLLTPDAGSPDHFAVIDVSRVTFIDEPGAKRDIDVSVADVQFMGALSVMSKLAEYLPFGDGVSVTTTPAGIGVHLGIELPAIEVGVFTLKNLAFSSDLRLPFTGGDVSIRFAFNSRANPASLTVSGLGGGGHFALEASPSSAALELALEFGADVGINLGVASGSVEIKAGVFFGLRTGASGSSLELQAYIRFRGQVTVLEVLSISLDLRLELTYKNINGNDKLHGRAVMIVEVDVAMVSATAELEFERTFSGNDSDPLFGDLVTAPDWADYTTAFAPLPR